MIITAILYIIVGFGVGLLSGLLGVGGGTIMVPVFTLAFGLNALTATGTSLFSIIPTSLSGSITHLKNKTASLRQGLLMGIGGACASPLGVLLAQHSPEWLVVCMVALVIMYSAFTSLKKALKKSAPRASGKTDANSVTAAAATAATPRATTAAATAATSSATTEPVAVTVPTATTSAIATAVATSIPTATNTALATQTSAANKTIKQNDNYTNSVEIPPFTPTIAIKSILIGLVAGFAGGYVGLGGGFIMVPLMSSLLNFPMRLASGTSLIGIICIAIPGALTQAMGGNVDFLVGILIACGSIPGAIVGARLIKRFDDRSLRFMFSALLGLAAILLIVKQFA